MKERIDLQPETTPVIILAGGQGTRIKEVAGWKIPKSLIEIAPGVTILDQLINGLSILRFNRFVLCLGFQSDQIIKHLKEKAYKSIELVVEDHPLGTGGAIKKAIEERNVAAPFLLVTSDAIFPYSKINSLLSKHKPQSITWAVSSIFFPEMKSHLTQVVDKNTDAIVGKLGTRWVNQKEIEMNKNVKIYLDGGHGIIDPILFLTEYKFLQKICKMNEVFCLYGDILPMLAEQNRRRVERGRPPNLIAIDEADYVIDIGTPETLKKGVEWYSRCQGLLKNNES